MPRILRITPEMAGVPAVAPLARQDPSASGWGTVAHAAGGLARTVAQTGGELLRIQGALQAEDAKLDMQERFNKLKYDFALREAEIVGGIAMPEPGPVSASDAGGGVGSFSPTINGRVPVAGQDYTPFVPEDTPLMPPGAGVLLPAVQAVAPQPQARPLQPKDYAQTFGKEIDTLAEESVRGLKYPGMERQYRNMIAPFLGAQKVEALNRGIKLQHEAIILRHGLDSREEANTAVFGTPADRSAAFGAFTNRVQDYVAKGILSGAQGDAELARFQGMVERGEVARDMTNPERRPVIVDRLISGRYKAIPPAEQLHMAQTAQDQYDARARQAEVDARRQFTEDRDYIVTDLFSRAADKSLTSKAELDEWARRWRIPRDAYEQILTEMTKPAVEMASDPATLDRIEPDTHSISPRITEQELLNLKSQGLLNRKDYLANLNRLRETQEGLRSRGETIGMRNHAQAEQELKAMLAIPPLYDKLDQNKERALKTFLPELRARSSMFGGKEDPLAVLESLRPRIEEFMGADASLSAKQLADIVGKHATYEALMSALRNKEITAGEFQTKARAFREMERQAVERRTQDLKAAIKQNYDEALRLQGIKPPAGAPGGPPKAGSPSGGRIK